MTTTITASAGSPATTSPALVFTYAAARRSPNRVHELISGAIAVVRVAAQPRTGRLELFYLTATTAMNSFNLHSRAATFTLVNTGLSAMNMTYVVSGSVNVAQDSTNAKRWIVTVEFQEIIP